MQRMHEVMHKMSRVQPDEDSASEKDGDGYAAAESEDELVFETISQSPLTNRTRSKSRKVMIPDTLMCS